MVAAAILPAFMTHLRANSRNELRSSAVSAAQERLEALRLQDPASMPDSGSSAPQQVNVDGRDFDVVTHYCERSEYCSDDRSRHLRVEVRFGGRTIYDVETVYTQLV
jgi:general secretion pathway protein I